MKQENICQGCRIDNTCPQKQYSAGEKPRARNYFNCMFFTNDMPGKEAARDAMRKQRFVPIALDGENIQAARFGTLQKPTQFADGEFQRLVTIKGEIIVRTASGEFMPSGQKVVI